MKSTLKRMVVASMLAVLSMSANSSIITGELSYDDTGTLIISRTNGQGVVYQGWGVAASLTYDQTVSATGVGGLYEGYHIASQTEAIEFYNLATGKGIGYGHHESVSLNAAANDEVFGQNYNSQISLALFLSDAPSYAAGVIRATDWGAVSIDPSVFTSINDTDSHSEFGSNSSKQISWLLVSDSPVDVPEPATLSLLGLGLAGLGFARRQKKL